jgi:hypothetical protein
MNLRRSVFLLSMLILTGVLTGSAQPAGAAGALAARTMPVDLRDEANRPFETARLTVVLVAAPGYENGQSLTKNEVEFTVGEHEGKTYPVENGRASVAMLAPSDDQSQPFQYEFSAKGGDGATYVTDSPVEVGAAAPHAIHLHSITKAPLSHNERYSAMMFAIIAIALVVLTFFYLAFRRMLFNRRMEVHSAVLGSYILTFLYLILASSTILVAYFNPSLLTSQASTTYMGLVVVFLGVYLFGLLVMMLMTRPRLARS